MPLARLPARLAATPLPLRWAFLVAASALIAGALAALQFPAALLLAPMLVALILAITGAGLAIPQPAFATAQSVVGGLIASGMPVGFLHEIGEIWPIFLAAVFSTLIAANLIGWVLTRLNVVPGITAIWGSSPGAASAMTLMSEGYGADIRLVALMQYLRVICCALAAVLVVYLLGGVGAPAAAQSGTAQSWADMAATLAVCAVGGLIGVRLRLPGGPLLAASILGIAMKLAGLASMQLPLWILEPAYAVVGWTIGMRFTGEVVRYALAILPRLLAGIVTLIALCGGFAALLVHFAGIDPLTAYLATSPGGADTIAIIAASGKVDVAFVMSMQIGRFAVVLMVGPALARWLTRRAQAAA